MPSKRSKLHPNPQDTEAAFPQLRLYFTDDVQERYEIARPLLLGHDLTAVQRAQQTHTHPQTVRRYVRRFEQEGMRGLFDEREVLSKGRTISETVQQEVVRLKTLHPPLHHREIANIIYAKLGCRIDHKAVQRILQAHPPAVQGCLPFVGQTRFHHYQDPYQARVEVIKLYYGGWNIQSISSFLGVSRKHIYTLLERFESEMFAGLVARSHAAHQPRRKLYLPTLKKIADLQREYPYVGRFRLWGLLKREGITDLGESTVGAAMALNRFVYTELAQQEVAKPPRSHPFKSKTWHQFWFIDHRYLVKIDGIQYYSLAILEGYSRAFLSGIVLATQSRGPVLKLLHDTVTLWGTPGGIVSDSGGAFISHDYSDTCGRLGIVVHHIESGQSWQNLIETHFNIQRRLGDFQFEQATSEAELQNAHMRFMDVYNSLEHWAHQKRKAGQRTPHEVLSWVRGRALTSRQLNRAFRETLWKRVTNRAGYVVVQNYYLYAERALSRQPVSLWLWEDTLRIDHRDEPLASYPLSYDHEKHAIERVGEPILHDNHFAQQQPQLLQLNAEHWQRVSQRAPQHRTRRPRTSRAQLRLPGIAAKSQAV